MEAITFASILADVTSVLASANVLPYVTAGVVFGLTGILIRQIKRAGR